MAKDVRAFVQYGRQGGKIGGAARMASMSAEQRSDLASRAAARRWARDLAPSPQPYEVINAMLEAISATGRVYVLYTEGDNTWRCERDSHENKRLMRLWESIEKDPTTPPRRSLKCVGSYGALSDSDGTPIALPNGIYTPAVTLSHVMNDLLEVPVRTTA